MSSTVLQVFQKAMSKQCKKVYHEIHLHKLFKLLGCLGICTTTLPLWGKNVSLQAQTMAGERS